MHFLLSECHEIFWLASACFFFPFHDRETGAVCALIFDIIFTHLNIYRINRLWYFTVTSPHGCTSLCWDLMFSLLLRSHKTSRIRILTETLHTHPTFTAFLIVSCSSFFPSFPFFFVCSTFPEGFLPFPGSFATSFQSYSEHKWKKKRCETSSVYGSTLLSLLPFHLLLHRHNSINQNAALLLTEMIKTQHTDNQSNAATTPCMSLRD